MRKGTDVLNKPIVAFETGEVFGRVKDLLFDQHKNVLIAFLLEEGSWFNTPQVLPLAAVQAIGADAIITGKTDTVISASHMPDVQAILDHNNILKGTRIMTVDGRDLGQMIDLYFDQKTGQIEGYEVSGGLFADAYTGRSFVPAVQTLQIGKHYAFVPAIVAALMEEQVGGLKAAMLTASDKVQETAQKTGEAVQAAAAEAGNRLEETRQRTAKTLTDKIVDPAEQRRFVLGKQIQENVLLPDGRIFLLKDRVVTATDVSAAEAQGVLDRLYKATGGDVWQEAGSQLRATTQQAMEQAKLTGQKAGETLQAAKQDVTAAMTNALVDPATQKEFVVGKTAQWTIATPLETILVMADEVVTPRIASEAEQQGLLTELYQATGGGLSDAIAHQTNRAVAGYTVEQALGRRVQQMVQRRDGMIVAAPGQIVTEIVLERAKTYHQEAALLEAVGLSTKQAVSRQTDGVLTAAGQATDDLGRQVKREASQLWDWVRETTDEIRGRSTQAIEEQRIRGALGRPVTRVILDPHDQVLLNVGELVTHSAIEAARRADMLDVVLNSVYTQTPEFSKAELRAPESGRTALKPSR